MARATPAGRPAASTTSSSVTRHPPNQHAGRGDAKTDELTQQVMFVLVRNILTSESWNI